MPKVSIIRSGFQGLTMRSEKLIKHKVIILHHWMDTARDFVLMKNSKIPTEFLLTMAILETCMNAWAITPKHSAISKFILITYGAATVRKTGLHGANGYSARLILIPVIPPKVFSTPNTVLNRPLRWAGVYICVRSPSSLQNQRPN